MSKYSFLLFLASMLPLASFLSDWSLLVNFSVLNLGMLNMSLSVLLDKQASIFVFTVAVIFVMVFLYSFSYLSEEVYLKRFVCILSLFASSMCILILSGSLFNSLIGWDGLGVTSLFLILFYYSNSALKASSLTFLMNRVGDCFFIMTLTSLFLFSEEQIYCTSSYFTWQTCFLLILTSITKSAQIPFSTWLPAAMEAPTPVSSLVHSSTLVTAGIFLLYRYSQIWVNSNYKDLLLILSVGTCFMAALSALVENDLKKLIALSTLSQLGFIMFSFSLKMLSQGFMHMIMHAFFKALLFMCAGLMIHSFKGTQSILSINLSGKQNPVMAMIMSCSLMSMMGLPYLAGFYSKDQIMDALKHTEWSILIYTLMVLSFMCTSLYSVRVVWYLMASSSKWHTMSDSDYSMIKPMLPLAALASLGGSITCWLLMEVEMFLDSSKVSILMSIGATVTLYWVSSQFHQSKRFLESKWNLSNFNLVLSKGFFSFSLKYQNSSDLLGIPGVMNKWISSAAHKMSSQVGKTMVHYSGNLEFLLFLVAMILIVK